MSEHEPYKLRPEIRPAKPVRTSMLNYEPAPSRRIYIVTTGQQFVLGIGYPFAFAFIVVRILQMLPWGTVAFWLGAALFIGGIVYVRFKLQWNAFLAGVLCSLLALPLLFVLTCGAIFSMFV